MAEQTKAKVNAKNLAFWETLIDIGIAEPSKYLKNGEKLIVIGTATVYGGIQGDKEYYKVIHSIYGSGYVRANGITAL